MKRAAFTLVELMLVLVIIGVVYGLVISGMQRYTKGSFELSLSILPGFLNTNYPNKALSFICVDECSNCYVQLKGKQREKIDFSFDKSLHAYRFDQRLGTREKAWAPLFDEDGQEQEVCLKFEKFPDGSTEQILIAYKDEVILYPGFFGKLMHYTSLEKAVVAYQRLTYEVLQ